MTATHFAVDCDEPKFHHKIRLASVIPASSGFDAAEPEEACVVE